jgi:hypothetical protein
MLIVSFGTAQVKNSNKMNVADFFDASSKRVTINKGEFNFQFRLWKDTLHYVSRGERIKASDTIKIRTAEKIQGLFLDGGFTNTKSFIDVDQFDLKSVGYKLGVTYQHAFSKIYYHDSSYTKIIYPKLFAWKVSLTGTLDRFDNYDPVKEEIDNVTPLRAGIDGNLSWYLFSNKSKWSFHAVPTLTARINFIDYNEMDNYLLNSNVSSNSQVTFTSNSTFDGKYGTLENDFQTSYVAMSLPLISKQKTFLTYLTPIPHFSWQTFGNKRPQLNTGMALGFLTQDIIGSDEKEDETINKDAFYKELGLSTLEMSFV